MTEIASAVDRIYREEADRLYAYVLSKVCGDFQVFNAEYEAEKLLSSQDISLFNKGISLARLLDKLLPNTPEIMGILALMLFHVFSAGHAHNMVKEGL